MDVNLPQVIVEYLIKCGISEKEVNKCTLDTRLYQDLGIYGEIAEECIETLRAAYCVDLDTFDFDKYFPQEYPGATRLSKFLLWQFPFVGCLVRHKIAYRPVTLRMIGDVIRSKRWLD